MVHRRPQLQRRLGQIRRFGPAHHWFSTYHARPGSRRPLTLLDRPAPSGAPVLVNIANLGRNAGDILLTVALRDLLTASLAPPIRWQARNAHHVVSRARLAELNRSAGVVIGGGGLFFSDTNHNDLSGWQWSCSVEALRAIEVPVAVMAVGYNQFRGQAGFPAVFEEHLRLLVEKAVFVGVRNHGSRRALGRHLPPELAARVGVQPCATTLLDRIYPDLVASCGPAPGTDRFVAVNAAYDHLDLRLGDDVDHGIRDVARALRDLSRDVEIRCYAHRPIDRAMTEVLTAERVPFSLVDLSGASPRTIIEAYAAPATVLGMRGHAQLIPFGCGRPVVSLISHDKVRYFLEDVDAVDWGIEMGDDGVAERVIAVTRGQLDDLAAAERRVQVAQEALWEATTANIARVAEAFGLAHGRR